MRKDVPVPKYRLGAIAQLHSPAEDFEPRRNPIPISFGTDLCYLGRIAKESWMSLFGSLCFLMVGMCLIQSHCLAADRFEQQQRDRRRHHKLRLPV